MTTYKSRDFRGRFTKKNPSSGSELRKIWKRPLSKKEQYVLYGGLLITVISLLAGLLPICIVAGAITFIALGIVSSKEEAKANAKGIFPVYKLIGGGTLTRLTHFRTWVAGLEHHQIQQISHQIIIGTMLDLKREPDNAYDSNAISISFNGIKIGYLTREFARSFYKQFDNGDEFKAEVVNYLRDSSAYDRLAIDLIDVNYQKAIKKTITR